MRRLHMAHAQGAHIDRLFTCAYLPSCLLLLVLVVCYDVPKLSTHTRVASCYAGFTLLLAAVPLVSCHSRVCVDPGVRNVCVCAQEHNESSTSCSLPMCLHRLTGWSLMHLASVPLANSATRGQH